MVTTATKRASVKDGARESEYTFDPVRVPPERGTPATEPGEFIRLPKHGQRCPHSGLSRAYLYDLVRTRKVKGQIIRKRGALRGVVIVHWPSLKAYLLDAMQEPIPGGRKAVPHA